MEKILLGTYTKNTSEGIYSIDLVNGHLVNLQLIAKAANPTYLDYDVIHEQSYCYKVKSINGNCESEFSNIVCKTYLSLENINQTNTAKRYHY